MKVWVITEDLGPGNGDAVRAVSTTQQGAVAWIAGRCKCPKRHDIFCAKAPASLLRTLPADAPPEVFEEWRLEWRAWRKQFCQLAAYDVEEWETGQ